MSQDQKIPTPNILESAGGWNSTSAQSCTSCHAVVMTTAQDPALAPVQPRTAGLRPSLCRAFLPSGRWTLLPNSVPRSAGPMYNPHCSPIDLYQAIYTQTHSHHYHLLSES